MLRILLVDDDDDFRVMLRITLQLLDHKVQEARNGSEAMIILDHTPFDVVITDIVMPESDGLQLIGEMRRKSPEIKIVAMSGGGRTSATDYLKMAELLGATGILYKPFLKSDIVDMLARVTFSPG